jgi:hypothetical protein
MGAAETRWLYHAPDAKRRRLAAPVIYLTVGIEPLLIEN